MPRTKRPDVFQLAVATRSYSSVDGYRKEIDVLKNELAQARQRFDDQARDFAREREDLQRQLRVKKSVASPEKPIVVKKDDAAQRWEARCAELAAQRALYDAARSGDAGAPFFTRSCLCRSSRSRAKSRA